MTTFTRTGHEGVKFFIGGEVEQTAAFNKKTLFVVGYQNTSTIKQLANEHNIKHIFLSANRSFDSVEKRDGHYMVGNTFAADWDTQITELLDTGFMVSLDYPAHKHVMVLEILNDSVWQSRNFVPILSVAVPHINDSNVNLTIKIDDTNFGATNPGVWCINHHEITDSNRFTSWDEYTDDVIIDVAPTQPPKAVKQAAKMHTDESINSAEIGLDTSATSSLKPDPDEVPSTESVIPTTPVTAADAYAAGAIADPLSAKESIKPAAARPAPKLKPATAPVK